MENMKLWDQVCETNPTITKQVNQRGGFTAVCAQAQRKRATEIWGNYGQNWGLSDIVFGTINDGESNPREIYVDAVFYYPEGKFQIGTDKIFKAGDDNRKKLITDATTKALSMLGFNSDIFEGKFDDNKYVSDMLKKFSTTKEPDPPKKQTAEERARETEIIGTLQGDIYTVIANIQKAKIAGFLSAPEIVKKNIAYLKVNTVGECEDELKLKNYLKYLKGIK